MLPGSEAAYRASYQAFVSTLGTLGHVEGREVRYEVRWADDRLERLPALAAELVSLNPAVVLTSSSAGIAAMKAATSTIPVVFATGFSPVEQGFVKSLKQPGGNITGVTVHQALTSKLTEVAREAFPEARRVAILLHDADPVHRFARDDFERAAARLRFEPVLVHVAQRQELGRAFADLKARRAEMVLLPQLTLFDSARDELAQRAIEARLPLLSVSAPIAESGGLISYGTVPFENFRRAAVLVDRILRGEKPADIAVEQPERFQLLVNRKTAAAIGAKLSPTTLLRADRVIE